MKVLEKVDRDLILNTLREDQKDYLHNFLKRGKKTTFSNILAKFKGENSALVGVVLEAWELIDYLDAGKGNYFYKCECGKSLRYQYIVKNRISNSILKFGINHFQEHTQIPAKVVRDILNGWNFIDYELDEILMKFQTNWRFNEEIPPSLKIPQDIKEHLELDIPLLDRQIVRLTKLIAHEKVKSNPFKKSNNQYKGKTIDLFSFSEPSDDCIGQPDVRSIYVNPIWSALHVTEQNLIKEYVLENEIISTINICIELMDKHDTDFGYFSKSGKPKLYVVVSSFLDHLVAKGELEFVIDRQQKDRVYQKVRTA